MNKRERAQRKPSFGIALCRRDPESRMPQVLLVQSRLTYSFSGFVFGKYKPWDNERLIELFSKITSAEKLLVLSCDFSRLWHHIWQKVPEVTDPDQSFYQFYINSRSKFERLVQRDNGKRLRMLLTQTPTGELGWDIPGGKADKRADGVAETELETAQRELREEGGVAETDYHILYDVRPICSSFEDDNDVWVRKYFVAWTDQGVDLRLNYNHLIQISEVSQVRWFSLRDMHGIVAQNKCLHDQVRLALTLFKRRVPAKNN